MYPSWYRIRARTTRRWNGILVEKTEWRTAKRAVKQLLFTLCYLTPNIPKLLQNFGNRSENDFTHQIIQFANPAQELLLSSYHLNGHTVGSPSQAHLYHGFDSNTHLNVCFLSVTSWDGGENSVDNSVGEPGRKRQRRDSWDDEYDRGKVTLIQGRWTAGNYHVT